MLPVTFSVHVKNKKRPHGGVGGLKGYQSDEFRFYRRRDHDYQRAPGQGPRHRDANLTLNLTTEPHIRASAGAQVHTKLVYDDDDKHRDINHQLVPLLIKRDEHSVSAGRRNVPLKGRNLRADPTLVGPPSARSAEV